MFSVAAFVFFLIFSFAQAQDKFQKCCGDRKLYYKGKYERFLKIHTSVKFLNMTLNFDMCVEF